jgi:hypothetical protein
MSGGRVAATAIAAALAGALAAGCGNSSHPSLEANRGQIDIVSQTFTQFGGKYTQASVTANFIANAPDPLAGCTTKRFGACTTRSCQAVIGRIPDGGAPAYVSDGEIKVTGALTPVTLAAPAPMGMFAGQYFAFSYYMPLYAAGSTLNVSGAGDVAPAFMASVVAPAQPAMLDPSPSNQALMLARGSDLKLAWRDGSGGTLALSLAIVSKTSLAGVDCSFPVEAGSGSVPAAALATLPSGSGQVYFTVAETQTVTVGSWSIGVSASTAPTAPDGGPFTLVVMLP